MKTYFLLSCILPIITAQRVAPGVPPQQYVPQQQQYEQYQQPPQPQVYQPSINEFNQMPQQQNMQQQQIVQQQQQQQQQVPVQQQQNQQPPPGHAQQPHQQQIFGAAKIADEKEHIAEHLEVPMDTSKMSEQELQFHYFKMHDADNNNKLDGCELIKSLIHWHEQGNKDSHGSGEHHAHTNHVEEKVFSDEELAQLIDPILLMDDASNDGFIDYPEFVRAQNKANKGPSN